MTAPFTFDQERATVSMNGRSVHLMLSEARVLAALLEDAGKTVTWSKLAPSDYTKSRLLRDDVEGRAAVRTAIKRLRRSLATLRDGFDPIANHNRVGYRWDGPVPQTQERAA